MGKQTLTLLILVAAFAGCKKRVTPKMIDFSVPEINGGTCTLADGKGKVLLLELFSYRCGYCRKQAKDFNELANEIGADKLQIMAVHVSGGDRVKTQVKAMFTNPKIKVCLDTGVLSKAIKKELPKQFHVRGIPHTLLIKDGKIRRKLRGYHTKSALKTILKKYL